MIAEGKETILIIDDEDRLREVLGRVLTGFGYTVIEARNGADALDQYELNKNRIDLILCDMGMPEMNGEEFFEKIKTAYPDVKLIIMSGYLDGGKDEELLEKGVKALLNKPFVISQIMQVIQQVLAN